MGRVFCLLCMPDDISREPHKDTAMAFQLDEVDLCVPDELCGARD